MTLPANRKSNIFTNLIFSLKNIFSIALRAFSILMKHGFSLRKSHLRKYFYILRQKRRFEANYKSFVAETILSDTEKHRQKKFLFALTPLISILTPTYNTPVPILDDMISSVLCQTYSYLELCIADGGSNKETVERIQHWQNKDSRIKAVFLAKNKGISANTNEAFHLSNGEYIAFLDHDDMLTQNALFEIVKAINKHPEANLIYSDEDKVTTNGKIRYDAFFKPDWSPDMLRAHNYICHFAAMPRGVFLKAGMCKEEYDGAQDYDLFLRIGELSEKIYHISKILYHWRASSTSILSNPNQKLYAFGAGVKALQSHTQRLGLDSVVNTTDCPGLYDVNYILTQKPTVSIITFPHNESISMNACLHSVVENTDDSIFDIIGANCYSSVISNFESNHKIKFSKSKTDTDSITKSLNTAVSETRAEYLLFLSSASQIISPRWLEELLCFCQRKEVGAVGAMHISQTNSIFNAGYTLSSHNVVKNIYQNAPADFSGYMLRLRFPHNVIALLGSCLMVRKDFFLAAKGFDENLKSSFFDVDLCLKLRELGKINVLNPRVKMRIVTEFSFDDLFMPVNPSSDFDYESDKIYARNKWKEILTKPDPYYNRNLSPNKADFSLNV